ncbi:MAG: tetratricopeptide repeat protein [Gemmatimonadetes bacterium]|nr:tetratricopeptide repeat protein [Gemmatimonadota bacterium]
MAIRGSLKEASLPDVLQLLALGQKTGCLSIVDRNNIAHVYFEKGRICYASIVNRRDRLGDILVKNGKISQEQLDQAIQRQTRARDKRLGELLIDSGALSQADLEHYMRMQIQEAVYFLFTWTRGTFNFEADVRPEPRDFLVSINPESLLLEGARRVDEWSLIEKKVPSFDLIFRLDRDRLAIAEDVELTPEQQRILPLLDGTRDVTRVIEDSGLVEFDVGKALYGLLTAGFAQRAGRSQATASAAGDARVDEHRNLGIAFYRTAMLDEAAREFRRVAGLRPTDGSAFFYLGLVALKQAKWTDAVEHFTQAAERGGGQAAVLHNLAYAHERAGQLDQAETFYGEAASRGRHDPRHLIGWGIAALLRGDAQVAGGRLDRAREVAGDKRLAPVWYWARALAAAAEGELDASEAQLREGIELYPQAVVLRNNLAALLELMGNLDQAVEVLRAALVEEPSLPQLSKNLGDVLYRQTNYDEAWDAYQRAIKLDPRLGDDVYFKLGNIAYKRLDRDSAARMWHQALELNPKHELARANLDAMSALA